MRHSALMIYEVLRNSPESNMATSAHATILYNGFEKYTFKITATYPRGQWVNMHNVRNRALRVMNKLNVLVVRWR